MEYDETVEALLRASLALTPNPEERIREHFESNAPETCNLALEVFAEFREYLSSSGR